jgi:hypothetical protein
MLVVAGIVVLMGDEKIIMALKGNKKIGRWALALIGVVVSVWRFIGSLEPIERSSTYYIYPETRIHDFFQQFFLNPIP